MTIQTEKATNNDYTMLIKSLHNFSISLLPIIGPFYNAVTSAQIETRLEELAKQLQLQQLETGKLKSFILTDEGYSYFTQCLKHSLSCYKKDRIKIFVSILKGCYKSDNTFDIQYHNILMQTISEMTSIEFQLLTYIDHYCNEHQTLQNPTMSNDEFYIIDKDKDFYDTSFNKFLSTQTNGICLLENIQFFLLRLSNLGIIKSNRKLMESYNITPLGKQLLSYIELLKDSESSA